MEKVFKELKGNKKAVFSHALVAGTIAMAGTILLNVVTANKGKGENYFNQELENFDVNDENIVDIEEDEIEEVEEETTEE